MMFSAVSAILALLALFPQHVAASDVRSPPLSLKELLPHRYKIRALLTNPF
jgi:hypothetical protein